MKTGTAELGVMAAALHISFPGDPVHLSVRRVDGAEVPPEVAKPGLRDDRAVALDELKSWFPSLPQMQFREVGVDLGNCDLYGDDGRLRLNVVMEIDGGRVGASPDERRACFDVLHRWVEAHLRG